MVRALRYGIIALLFLAPLLFGTVEPWSLALMETTCISLFAVWIVGAIRKGEGRLSYVKPPLLLPIGIIFALSVMQVLPLPPSLLKLISPQTYKVYLDSAIYQDNPGWRTISLYPHATILEIVRLFAYLCIYILTFQVLHDRESVGRMVMVVLVIGVFIALTGIFQIVSWNRKVLWLREFRSGFPFGAYFNRNHFAGLMEMAIPVSIGMGIYLLPSVRKGQGLRSLTSGFFTGMHANKMILTMTGVIVMTTALFLSLSRGGIVALSLSMLFFGIALSLKQPTRNKGWIIVSIFIIIIFSVGWFGWEPIIDKFGAMKNRDVSTGYRINVWRDTVGIVKDFPLFGTGLGTYEHIYPRYKTVSSPERWEHAHNDYLEGAVELGIPGMSVALFLIVAFYRLMFMVLNKRNDPGPRLLAIGGMTGITALMIHSLTDFNLHIGANGLFFSFLLGFSIVSAHAKMTGSGHGTILKVREVIIPSQIRRAVCAGIVALSIIFSVIPMLNAGADILYRIADGSTSEGKELAASRSRVFMKAALLSPLDARYPFAIGNASYILGNTAEATVNYMKTVALNPVDAEYLQMLGIGFDSISKAEHADRYMRLAVEYDPMSSWRHKNYSLWLFSRERRADATKEMKKAISLDPSNTRNYIMSLVLNGLDPDEIRGAIPDSPVSLVLYARYREEIGDADQALRAYLDALSLMKKSGKINPEIYGRIASIYEQKKLLEEAALLLNEGINKNPSDYGLRQALARVYEKLDVPRAIGEYENMLKLNPADSHAKGRLKELGKRKQDTY